MPLFSDDLFLGAGATYMGTGPQSATATISATISGTTLTVAQYLSGDPLVVGQYVTGSSVTAGSYITANLGNNQYTLSASSTVGSAETMWVAGNALLGDPSPMSLGVGPLGRIYVWDTIPQAQQSANVAGSQTPAGAGSLTLAAGTSSKSVVLANGSTVIQLDCPRAVSVSQVTGGNVVNVTVSGYDYYGQAMTQTISSSPAGTASTLKAFYQVSSISVDGATGTAVTAGTTNTLGLPVRVIDAGYIIHVGFANALGADAGTFTAADTATASATTGDVRGTYVCDNASPNGENRLVMAIALPALAVGPNSTRTGALGVTQA